MLTSAGDVYEVSRAFLAERSGFVAVIKVYMDESGTHDASPYLTVGAYAAQPKQWRKFTAGWNAAKKPVNVFHSSDCQALKGEFLGWSEDQRNAFVAKLLPVIRENIPLGVVIGIDIDEFRKQVAPYPDLMAHFAHPYASCFHWVVSTLIGYVEEAGSNERLAFFHENNDYEGQAQAAFSYISEHRKTHRAPISLTFGTKADYVPLQAADVLAYEGNKRMQGVKAGRTKRLSLVALDPDEKRLTIRHFGKAKMPWLVERLRSSIQEIKTFGQPLMFLPD